MTNFAVRITLPFSDLSGAMRAWALKVDSMLVYEHIGGKTEKVHIHALLMGCNCDAERLKQIVKEYGITSLKGNADWSFKTKHKELGAVTDDTKDGFVTYMSKGQLMPMYNKGYTDEYCKDMRDRWVDPKEYGSKSERNYNEFEKTVTVAELRSELQQRIQARLIVSPLDQGIFSLTIADVLAQKARSWAFHKSKRIYDPCVAGRLAKMVFLTFCMRNDIDPGNNVKLW